MNKKLQVFVSSTYTDLIPERQAAVEAILSAGHIPAGMELFAAGDEEQMKVIRDWIDDSDVYMLILGGRYGSVERKSGKSYTQLEYEYALKRSKPLFAVYMTPAYFEQKVKEMGPAVTEQRDSAALNAFRETVLSRLCKSFGSLPELQVAVHQSLNRIARDESLTGWVKGNEVVDTKKTLEELTRLQSENSQLRSEVETLRAATIAPSPRVRDLVSDDAIELLLNVALDPHGHLIASRTSGGLTVQSNGRNFAESGNHRSEVRWEAAIEELASHDLVRAVGSRGEIYRITDRGYRVSEEITRERNPAPQVNP